MKFQTNKPARFRKRGGLLCPSPVKPWRFHLIRTLLFFIGLVIFLRLVQIQIFDSEQYIEQAFVQYTRTFILKAKRGLIYDRNMTALALNKPSFDIGLDKRLAHDFEATSQQLAKILNQNPKTLLKKIQDAKDYVLLARKLEEDEASIIKLMNLPGIKIIELSERDYPLNEKLAQVIGFLDVDGRGISGIEFAYDDYLSGKDGQSILQRDAKGKIIMPINSTTQKQKSGHNVILTIDNVLQTIAEEELKQAVQQFNAQGGNVIISNPNTGEILAMASAPGFDANHATRYRPETWRIRAITDIFEPGSTYKIVTMMSALAGKYKKLNDIIYCENGTYEMFGEQINDAEKHGWLSVKNVFVHSSNIGIAKIAQAIGKDNLFIASRNFGFGNKTGIELPGEVSGILKKPSEWSGFTLAAVSYGHEVAVTPLQVAMAYGAIANGGTLMKATIVKEITDQENRSIYKFQPQRIRKVMEPETACELATIMVDVVEKGTGQSAKIPNIKIAGKTGTAQKPLQNGKGYSTTKFVASFAGFYPAEGAKFLIYVTIDEPYPIHSGGNVAAPAFRNILKRILKLYNQPTEHYTTKELDESPNPISNLLPELVGRSKETALHVLKDLNIEPQIYGQGEFVQKLQLTTVMDKEENRQIMLTLADYPQESEYTTIPDLKGMSLRKAVSELTMRGLKVKIFGSGRVVRQEPEAGTKSKVGATCVIESEPATKLTTIAKY